VNFFGGSFFSGGFFGAIYNTYFTGPFFSGGFFNSVVVGADQLLIKLRSFTERGRF
jgi:hypothetical protein